MIENLEQLTEFRGVGHYRSESTQDGIAANRAAILDSVLQISQTAVALVWLREESESGPEFRLSYMSPSYLSHCLSTNSESVGISEEESSSFGGELENRLKSRCREVLDAISLKTEIKYISLIQSRIPVFDEIHETEKTESMGFIAIGYQEDRPLNDLEILALDILKNRFAAIVEQSRMLRIKTASMYSNETVKKYPTISECLVSICKMLTKATGAEHALALKVRPDGMLECLAERAIESVETSSIFKDKMGQPIHVSMLVPTSRPTRSSNQMMGRLMECAKGVPAEIQSMLIAPIQVDGYKLEASTVYYSLDEVRPNASSYITHCILLFNKSSPFYVGNWFSTTDMDIIKTATERVSDYISSKRFERSFVSVAAFFESQRLKHSISATDVLEMFGKHIPSARNYAEIASSRYLRSVELGELWRPEDGLSENQLQQLKFLVRELKQNREPQSENGDDIIEYKLVPWQDDSLVVCLRMRPSNRRNHIAAIEIVGNQIEVAHWQTIRHFAHELFIFLKHQDNVFKNKSMMAQIRHAMIGPLSAAVGELRALKESISEIGRTHSGWVSLRYDLVMTEGLPKAVHLGTQARILADSAKLLTKERLLPSDIKRNQRFSPLAYIEEIRGSLDSEISRKHLKYNLDVGAIDRKFNAQGDRALMWMALYNVMDNAVKYSSMHTEITVKMTKTIDRWKVVIKNYGGYLDPAERDNVFRLFYRAQQQDQLNRRAGTGIGLSISETIIRAHSRTGVIEYNSKKGEGKSGSEVVFWIDMPINLPRVT